MDISSWPTVNIERLSENDRQTYNTRRQALEMYFHNIKHIEIERKTGIHRNEVSRLIKRCLEHDEHGVPWGYRALIPRKRISTYQREELPEQGVNATGAFNLLLNTYPVIKERVDYLFYKKKSRSASDPITRGKDIHKAFIKECRKVGLKAPSDYPFNQKELGRRSLYTYLNKLEKQDIDRASERLSADAANLLKITGTGQGYRQIIRPYEQVQFDGHKIDLHAVLVLRTPEGDEIFTLIDRIWLLVIFDVGTRCILGSHVCFNREYSSADVLHCIRNSVVPWSPKTLTIPDLRYPADGGYPSAVIEGTQWALWDEILYDQAKANLSLIVKDRLKQVIKCRVNPGKVGFPIKRTHIERWFGLFEENGFHRLPSTTGSHPNDPRRTDPAKLAKKHRITVQHVEELIDVMIADYNGTESEGVNFMTPLEAMKSRLQSYTVNQMPEEQRNDIAFLTMRTTREVKGDIKKGRRPFIQYENVRYTSALLVRSPGLVGKKLDIMVNIDDLRIVRAFLPDGSELGKLKATGKWGNSPHTLQVRREIFRLKRKKLLRFTEYDDPIEVYHRYLDEGATKSPRKAGKAYEMKKNQERNKTDVSGYEEEVHTTQMNYNLTSNQVAQNDIEKSETEVKHENTRKFKRAIVY